jgi:hypothetical protein
MHNLRAYLQVEQHMTDLLDQLKFSVEEGIDKHNSSIKVKSRKLRRNVREFIHRNQNDDD